MSFAAQVAITTGPVETHGPTVVKSANDATSWSTLTIRDHWISLIQVKYTSLVHVVVLTVLMVTVTY